VSALSASISHEIRNPLTVTNGFLQLLSKSKTLADDEKKFVDYSLQELNRAEGIVRDFLSLAKPQAENMVVTNLKKEFEYVNNVMLSYAHIHKVELEFNFTNTLVRRVDRNQVQQCLINLYKNGIEAMQETGGTLSIAVSEQKKNILIKISDSGVGMTKEQQERMGKPYYSTKEEGTGLGMMYVYSTVNSLKGRIEAESEQGKGTTFTLTIPAHRSSPAS
jgi:two-component system, sporulation sensor kinase B